MAYDPLATIVTTKMTKVTAAYLADSFAIHLCLILLDVIVSRWTLLMELNKLDIDH